MTEEQEYTVNASRSAPQPPMPPAVRPQMAFYPAQLIGMGLIMLLPILSLLGVFGENDARTVSTAVGALRLTVDYPGTAHYLQPENLTIHVTNLGSEPLAEVTVTISRAYLDGYVVAAFTPSPETITQDDYLFILHDVAAGAGGVIVADLQPGHYWQHNADVRATAAGDSAQLTIGTFIFP